MLEKETILSDCYFKPPYGGNKVKHFEQKGIKLSKGKI